jgi:hypothetical protein
MHILQTGKEALAGEALSDILIADQY